VNPRSICGSVRILLLIAASLLVGRGLSAQARSDSATSVVPPETNRADSTRVSIFADGNVRGVMTGGTQQSTVATGSLGLEINRDTYAYSALVVIKSSVDTLTDQVGATLLTPIVGNSLQAGLIDLHLRDTWPLLGTRVALHGYLAVSQTVWAHQDSASRVVVWSMGVMPHWDMEKGTVGENEVRLGVEAGIGFRYVAGDITPFLRKALLASPRKMQGGFEAALEIQWNKITARVQPSWYIGRPRIPGLSGWQVAGSFGMRGDVFTGLLKRKPQQPVRL